MNEACESVQLSARGKGIELTVRPPEEKLTICGDHARLRQTIWNLLSNALRFTSSGGVIEVAVLREEGAAVVSVRDTGTGVDPEFLPIMFERFRQADASTTRRYGGLGIGLALVKQLTELHGGSVSAASEGLGKGTTITVRYPLSADTPVAGESAPPASTAVWDEDAAVNLSGVRVLVVDDEADALELARRVLRDSQADVVTAGSAQEALELIESANPDVLVSDIGMPGQDGYELLRRVRELASPALRSMPAVAVTAFARAEDRERILAAGFQAHLAKPIELRTFLMTIASVVKREPLSSSEPEQPVAA